MSTYNSQFKMKMRTEKEKREGGGEKGATAAATTACSVL